MPQELSAPGGGFGDMKRGMLAAAKTVSTALVLMILFSQAAEAQTFVAGPADWTFVGTPVVASLGISQAAEVTFDNQLSVSVLGIVIMVLHNNLGQMVYYTTSTMNLTVSARGTVYLAEGGAAPGMYTATVFAISTGGAPISNSTTFAFAAT